MLYMNEPGNKKKQNTEQDDLFGYSDLASGTETPVDQLADVQPQREPEEQGLTPETLPLIQEDPPPAPQQNIRIEQKPPRKAPLIFSAHAPIPTRGGVREEEDTRRKRIFEQISREIPPLSLDQIPAESSLGKILTLARENAAYSIDAVADITRISSNFITAFENDDLKRLPPYIYQTAYLRELCKLYKVPAETHAFILQLHRKYHEETDGQNNTSPEGLPVEKTAEDRRASLFFTGGIIAIGVVIVIAVWAVIIALVKHNGEKEAYQQQITESNAVQPASTPVKFDQKKLEKLTPEPMLDLRMLEMSNSGNVRD